jgi:hypothetical protein
MLEKGREIPEIRRCCLGKRFLVEQHVFREWFAESTRLITSTRKDAHAMRDETHFKGRSVEVHRCCIYQILIGGQTGFNHRLQIERPTKRV